MDPQACYDALLDALHDKRHDNVLEHCDNLLRWQRKGGFIPAHVDMKWVWERQRHAEQASLWAVMAKHG